MRTLMPSGISNNLIKFKDGRCACYLQLIHVGEWEGIAMLRRVKQVAECVVLTCEQPSHQESQ
jgi:hypothetical protein